jgi:hypothetical protein
VNNTPETRTVVITLSGVAERYAQTEVEMTHGQLVSLLAWFEGTSNKSKTHAFKFTAENGNLLQGFVTRDSVAAIVTEAP